MSSTPQPNAPSSPLATSSPGLSALERFSIAQLGFMHLEHARYDEARTIFEGLSALAPREAYTWRALAEIARRQDKLDLAAQYIKHCADLEPKHAGHRVALAEVHLRRKDRDQAWAALSAIKERVPQAHLERDEDQRAALLRARVLLKQHFGL